MVHPAKLCATKRRTPHGTPGGEQVVGSLRPQAVRESEVAVEVAHVQRAPEGGQLVHDHLGLRRGDRSRHCLGLERVGYCRGRAVDGGQARLRREGT